ncbi:aromatic-ring-hydroxylating dioxygenase subunit beta [Marinobacter sp. UBA2678]|jgi:anthranilate 1,2-dioxygenase small subunit|uniref:aromatic-ring-hydroxylating dioxygenase subunit beta n=1 Tax=Marinobacter sp. UBA2678 TaxID=1946815 RepID=UPI000C0A31DF|nr:aromatic-ring-hydroxylating dioxygenase subunit beta [Marinobacter sp. UBA2678]MAM86675.1 terephthalate 1,2-dioxygenase [Hahellaceae bacterium]|tara:strand:+ start:3178 stop:3648 length:471 start_codon:yes stop_codon:yes gene_type:complete
MNQTQRERIEALYADYVAAIDEDRLEEWPAFFKEHCLYRITNRRDFDRGLKHGAMWANSLGMLKDRISALREANIYEDHTYRHITSAFRVLESNEQEAWVNANFLVIRTMQNGDMSLFAAGTYQDHIVFEGNDTYLAERIVICDSQKLDTLLAIPL